MWDGAFYESSMSVDVYSGTVLVEAFAYIIGRADEKFKRPL